MDLSQYRASTAEQQRTADLSRMMPPRGRHALDIGARDGHFSVLLADRFDEVTALDLVQPEISHPRIHCTQGNAAKMQFPDDAFDLVFCAEVLEHIPTAILHDVCHEIERVASQYILIGVPYKQDLRLGRTTCYSCGKQNPPWGHVNSFDEQRLAELFPSCHVESISFVGSTRARSNWLSAELMDFAGNPYGTYCQEETCIHCGNRLLQPAHRTVGQRVATRCATWLNRLSEGLTSPHGNWIHLALRKPS
jgi:SAM-dependent methyltransferase